MTRPLTIAMLCLTLAACGANGEPEQPQPRDGSPGIRVSGDARVGISVSTSGTHGRGAVALNSGPVTVGLGF